MVQMVAGLITYLLLAIYCHKHYQERVSTKRVRELRIKIINETRELKFENNFIREHERLKNIYAKT